MTFLNFLIAFGLAILAVLATLHLLYRLAAAINSHVLEYYARVAGSFVALFLCAAYGTVASAILNVVGYGGLGQWTTARSFKYAMLLFTGAWFEITDPHDWLNTTRPAVFIGNHQSELDVFLLGHIFPKYCSVTAKKSLKYWPFLGWFMALSKTVFIERSSRSQAFAAFDRAADEMHKSGQSVYIFPEGTRSYSDHPDMLPFKKGAFHLAIQAQVPIVPIVVANYSNVVSVQRKVFRAATVPITVLRPIQTKGKTKDDVPAFMAEVRALMLAELRALTGKARENGVARKEHEAKYTPAEGKATGVDLGIAT